MRHPRGIDLGAPIKPARYEEHHASPNVYETLNGMREWEVLGARCGKCGREAWLDRRKVVQLIGNHYLQNVAHKLRCDVCKNKAGNKVLIGRLGRD